MLTLRVRARPVPQIFVPVTLIVPPEVPLVAEIAFVAEVPDQLAGIVQV